jgi:hypothetical protein
LPIQVSVSSPVPASEVIARLTTLVDDKVPIGPASFFGYLPVVEGFAGDRFALRVQRRVPGLGPQGFNSFRVMATGSVVEREGETQVSAAIELIGSQALTFFKLFVFGFLGFFLIAGLFISAAQRGGPNLSGALVVTLSVLIVAGFVQVLWRSAVRGAAQEGELLAAALRRAAVP